MGRIVAGARSPGWTRWPQALAVAGVLYLRDEGKLDRRAPVDRAGSRLAPGSDGRIAVTEGHDRERKLVHAVGPHQVSEREVGEPRAGADLAPHPPQPPTCLPASFRHPSTGD